MNASDIILRHSKTYATSGDEAWGRDPICEECRDAWPCDVSVVATELTGEIARLCTPSKAGDSTVVTDADRFVTTGTTASLFGHVTTRPKPMADYHSVFSMCVSEGIEGPPRYVDVHAFDTANDDGVRNLQLDSVVMVEVRLQPGQVLDELVEAKAFQVVTISTS